jgi:parvulin-like peptidyl-prolyl isomerase
MTGSSAGLTMDKVLATVNNEVITLSDYRMFIGKTRDNAVGDAIDEHHLRRLIEERLIVQEARNAGMDASEEEVSMRMDELGRQTGRSPNDLQKRLADEGVTMAEYRKLMKENIMSLKIIDREVNARVIVSGEDIRQFYESNPRLFQVSPEKVLIKAIYLKLGDNASLTEITDLKIKSLRLYASLRKGESFDVMAMRHTDESLRKQAAVLGEFERGMLIPALDDRIFSLKEGEISEPVWTKDGVYILRAVKVTPPVYSSLQAVREQIVERLYVQKREAQFNEWMKRLWERASVTIRQ